MSYSSTPDLEFKGDNIDSICKELDLAVHAPWSCFESARSKCKNGVVEPGEQCDDNSGCCSDECTYTDQCTHEDNKCCTGSCTFQPGTHSCGFGKRYCTAGRCAADSVCESYSNLVPCTPSASHDDGCVQLCRERDSNTCYPAHWFGDAINATQARVQDGTVCSVSPVKTCQKGDCVAQ